MSESRLVLVGGGARSGKSAFALRLARRRGQRRTFIATAEAFDDEMCARIAAHAAERGPDFRTIEAPRDLDEVLSELMRAPAATDVVVVDCLTLWLSNLLVAGDAVPDVERRATMLAQTLAEAPVPVLLVTNEVGMGLVPETAIGRIFRDVAGRAHQVLARTASEVYLATLGCVLRLKPGPVALVEESEP
jgi:adenosylcobinamide kinase/adenosylcobinamide-phosphate guanylyltransferase